MSNTIDYQQRSLGLTFTPEHTARIYVWAPFATKVAVTSPANLSELPLQKDTDGYWYTETDQIKPGDLYTFVINDEQEFADPASLIQPQGVYGPSEAFDTSAFYWEDAHWINPPIDEYIIYELDICTFTPEGTLKALIRKLNHLKKLGVTAILLRPVTPFLNPNNRQQGAPFLYAIQTSCGGPAHLQQLVNACHFEGIAVILDLVYHRVEQPAKEFGNFGLLANSQARLPNRKPALSYEAHERYLIENMLMWFREFHIDALQLTGSQTLSNADQLLHQMRTHTSALTRITGRQYYLLAEHDMTQRLSVNDLQTWDLPVEQVSPEKMAEATGISFDLEMVAKRCQTRHYQESYLYDSHFSEALNELFDQGDGVGEGLKSVSQKGHKAQHSLLEAYAGQSLSTEFVKLMAGYILVSPCIPTLFMGEEWGAMNPFQTLAPGEPVPMDSAPESLLIDQESQSVSALPWEMLSEQPCRTLYQYYQSLTALRRQQPALYHLNPKQTRTIHKEGEPTIRMHRSFKANEVVCLMNFSPEKQIVTLPDLGNGWQKLLDSADPVWGGPGPSPELVTNTTTLTLQPESIVIYKVLPQNC
ncbi:alpha-amylase family glycosyl hydrolase [Spirosoma aerolatum]|uniref:alpha-amylase family glycosyl hydrolase n=1 Tax=Spirosoma aerolatum TaxID=1211326 RepID=UPI001475283A|nr:alpha-amylase family glycosyl hydrolase [Spirosoma aerolatum]